MHASTVPPPPDAAQPFTVARHRAFNDELEARIARSPSAETALRRARAEIDDVLALLTPRARRRGRR